MRKLAIALITTVLLAGSVAVVGAKEDGPVERILFVGNSFTSWQTGRVDDHFADLVAGDVDAPTVAIEDTLIMGGTLDEHLPSAPDIIRDGDYSIVVLQGDIPWEKRSVEPFFDAARAPLPFQTSCGSSDGSRG